jgi:FkbM family methyltransferase
MNTSLSSLLQLVCKPDNANHCFAIDVGAHCGEFAKFLISTDFFNHVVSFEPNPESYLKLVNEVFSTDNCGYQAINSALSDASGTLDLYCDEDTATASLLNYDPRYLINGTITKHAVPVSTLDSYLSNHPVAGKLQLLKIDTQGNDLSVIKGGGIRSQRIDRLFKPNSFILPCMKANVHRLNYQKHFF